MATHQPLRLRHLKQKQWLPLCRMLGTTLVFAGLGLLGLGLKFYPLSWLCLAVFYLQAWLLGHEAVHHNLARRPWMNAVIGSLALVPSLQAYLLLKDSHHEHHADYNILGEDPFWSPLTLQSYAMLSPWRRWAYRRVRKDLWWMGTLLYTWTLWTTASAWKAWPAKAMSALVCLVGFSSMIGGLFVVFGAAGLWHGFLIPWLIFHIVFSAISFVQHNSPGQRWHDKGGADARRAMNSLENILLPKPLSFLLLHIDVHVPHHVCGNIPFYHLPKAALAWSSPIKQYQGSFLHALRTVVKSCHLYDLNQSCFVSFHEFSEGVLSCQHSPRSAPKLSSPIPSFKLSSATEMTSV